MPHLIVSVSQDLAAHKTVLLQHAHQALLNTPTILAADVKSRVLVLDDFLVGVDNSNAFVHVEVRILQKPERTEALQKTLSGAITQALQHVLPPQNKAVQLSCEVILMNAAVYDKQKVVACA